MAAVLAVGEVLAGRPSRLTLEVATLAARLAGPGEAARILLVGRDVAPAAEEVAAHGPEVLVSEPTGAPAPLAAAALAPALALLEETRAPRTLLLPATADGKDLAGTLVGLTDLPILVAATGVERDDGDRGLRVAMSPWGGRLTTTSRFLGDEGIVLVRPGTVAPEPAAAPGRVVELAPPQHGGLRVPEVRVVERVAEDAARASIEDARAIVGGGRGLGGPEGFRLLGSLAEELGGAVGATRAAVDSGWADFGCQIGQTGKTVKPDLYVACGISGAIQHKVGIQSAGTIVAINRDRDAPVAEFADMLVVGDLFEIVPRLTEAIRAARSRSA